MGSAIDSSRFIVRRPAQWVLTGLPVFDPREIALDELVGFVHWYDPTLELDGAPLEVTDTVEPVHTLVGLVRDGHLVVEGDDGEELLLDRIDVELLDRLDGRVAVAELAARSGVDVAVCHARLRRLVAARRVRLGPPDSTSGSASASSLRGRARSVARRLRHGAAPEAVALPVVEATVAEPSGGPLGVPVEVVVPPAELPPTPPGLIPVYAPWHPYPGPPLSLGMLTAYARGVDGGRLTEWYDVRRPEPAESVLAQLAAGSGPAVLLCSDYVWSLDANLELARRAIAVRPDVTVVHGGPSAPEYEGDTERFFAEHGDVAHVVVNGEGEGALADLLTLWSHGGLAGERTKGLAAIQGLAFVDESGVVVRTSPRPRRADLDVLPSPYLSGEYDHIHPSCWQTALTVETNRGCPYGCTFCDWGSATASRLHMFAQERVFAELEWAASHDIEGVIIADSNFGIWARDVDFARRIVELKEQYGNPQFLAWAPAKNTTKHLSKIARIVYDAGIRQWSAMSPQSTDLDTLDNIGRSNISTSILVALGAEYRRLGLPVYGDLIIGLPGQTYQTYKTDLQFMFDHLVMARSHRLRVLPNAPMNEPGYRERHQIVYGDQGAIISTGTLDPAQLRLVQLLQRVEIVGERYNVLRHVLRWLQWDCDVPASDVYDQIVHLVVAEPERYPLIAWTFGYFEFFGTVPVGRTAFYQEVERFVVETYGVEPSSELRTVLAVQHHLCPAPGRRFPDTLQLDHDYVSYACDALEPLYVDGEPGTPPRPLREHGPGTLVVLRDPLQLCDDGLVFPGDSRDPLMEGDFLIGNVSANELDSPLLRYLPAMVPVDLVDPMLARPAVQEAASRTQPDDVEDDETVGVLSIPVRLAPRVRAH